jgi:hypothetical protein
MGLVAKGLSDKRVLKLIRGFLTARVLAEGLVNPTEKGTPHSVPLALRTAHDTSASAPRSPSPTHSPMSQPSYTDSLLRVVGGGHEGRGRS